MGNQVFAVGDIVRIVKQPASQIAHIVGEVGWISEILEGWANFEGLTMEGTRSGCGSMPLDCLALEPEPLWHAAKAKFDKYMEQLVAEGHERYRRRMEHVGEIARRHGMTVAAVLAVERDLQAFDD